jgi:hypothetical protein
MNSARPRRLHWQAPKHQARLLLKPARCCGKLVTGDRQAQHYSVVASSMAESTTPLAMVQAGHTVRQLLQGKDTVRLAAVTHVILLTNAECLAPASSPSLSQTGCTRRALPAWGLQAGHCPAPHTAASMYRTWLLLLRAVIQLPIMISVCAWVSSMGGTGYLQQKRHLISLAACQEYPILLQWFGLETAKQHVWGGP